MADVSTLFNPADIATASDAASDAQSKVASVSGAASDANSAASDALSKITTVSDAASDALSKASAAVSAVAARSAIWDKKCVILKVYDEASALSTADAVMHFTVPDILSGMNLVSCGGHLYTAATSGTVTVDFRKITSAASGTDMLSTALTFDATEKDTATAGTAAGIDAAADDVATADPIAVDVTAAASGAKGLEVRLTFKKP